MKSKPTPRAPADAARVAAILSDAALLGDAAAAKKHKVSTRTLRRWRTAADNERPEVAAQVAENVQEARERAVAGWANVIDDTIGEAIAYIRWAAKIPVVAEGMSLEEIARLRPNAIMVQSLVSAMKTLSEMRPKGEGEAGTAGSSFQINIIAGSTPPVADTE